MAEYQVDLNEVDYSVNNRWKAPYKDPIIKAQQSLQPARSTEEVYARSGLTQPTQETRPDYMPMDEVPPETVQTTPIAEDKPIVEVPKEPEVFDPEGSEYDYETAKQKGLDPKDIVRQDLYPGEDKYFKENPNVAGMMTEDNRVIINPYSKLTDEEKDAVRINETLRLNFKQDNVVPNIEISEEQRSFFKGTPYENDEDAMKQTIMARILTGDLSAKATEEQLKEAETDLFKAYKENIDHWGSVVPASDEDKLKYNLPKESYLLVKGKQHKTWDKAVQGEEERGFKIEKHGDRYFSVPQETETQGVNLDEEPIQEKLIYDDRLTPDDTTKPKAEALSNEEFINDWGKTYQTDNDPVKNKAALKRLDSFDNEIKPEATTAMQVAGAIFDGDKNVTSDQIIDYLTKVGIVESNFSTKKQKGNGPARSYWQVEPATALDLSKNSKAFFGNKFNTAFKKYAKDGETAIESLSKMSKEEISQLLLDDDRLAASFAAAKYIATR